MRNAAEDFHAFGKVAADGADDRACFYADEVFGVGYNNALYVFDEVSAAFCYDMFGDFS